MYEVCIVFDYKLPIYRARYFGANTMLLSMIPPRSSNQDLWAFAWLVLVISLYFTLNYPLASDEYVLLFSRGRKDFTAALATHSIIMPNICRISVNCFAIHSLNGNVKKYGRICNNRNPRKIGERSKKREEEKYEGIWWFKTHPVQRMSIIEIANEVVRCIIYRNQSMWCCVQPSKLSIPHRISI